MDCPICRLKTYLFPCLTDNFGVLIHDPASGATASIDAPEAAPVEAALEKTGWKLTDILVTHHHADHTAGIGELKAQHKCRVVAPRARGATHRPCRRDGRRGRHSQSRRARRQRPRHARATPPGHISYFFPADKLAFVGDTLFSIGCGRVIEGNPEMMWHSLLKLRGLPDDTRFYCGHEYTDANIRFAKTIEPNNKALGARADEVAKLLGCRQTHHPGDDRRGEGGQSVSARRRCRKSRNRSGLPAAPAWKVFAEIRERKNKF